MGGSHCFLGNNTFHVFRDIKIDNVNCVGAKHSVKIEPLEGRMDTISNITISNSNFEDCGEALIKGENINIEL